MVVRDKEKEGIGSHCQRKERERDREGEGEGEKAWERQQWKIDPERESNQLWVVTQLDKRESWG